MRRGEKIFELTLIFLWLFLRLTLALFPQSVKYDGVRHFLVILPARIKKGRKDDQKMANAVILH